MRWFKKKKPYSKTETYGLKALYKDIQAICTREMYYKYNLLRKSSEPYNDSYKDSLSEKISALDDISETKYLPKIKEFLNFLGLPELINDLDKVIEERNNAPGP